MVNPQRSEAVVDPLLFATQHAKNDGIMLMTLFTAASLNVRPRGSFDVLHTESFCNLSQRWIHIITPNALHPFYCGSVRRSCLFLPPSLPLSPSLLLSSLVCNVHLCISVVALLCEISPTDGMCLSEASPVTVPNLFNYG